MRLLTTVLASACIIGTLAGAATSAHADWDWGRHHGWRHHHWRGDRDWRWRHNYAWRHHYYAPQPRYYSYAYPPPVYYGPPGGVTFGFAIP